MDPCNASKAKTSDRVINCFKRCVICYVNRNSHPERKYFSFPRNPARQKQWLEACLNPPKLLRKTPQQLHKSYIVCSAHFSASDYATDKRHRLHMKACPKVYIEDILKEEYLENIRKNPKGASPDYGHSHDHGHTHEHMDSPGAFLSREMPISRKDFQNRAFTVGIGGPVGSGKTALVLALSQWMRDSHKLCIVTNDIFTREDWEFLVKNKALPEDRIRAVETGGCPHAAIREDYSLNLEVIKDLTREYQPEIIFLESGGDNLAANFSRDLADYIIYVIDVAGGDKIPRKGGPGITESDLLVINKVDLAEAVGADLEVMKRDACIMRQNGPTVFVQAKHSIEINTVGQHILNAYNSTKNKV